MHVKNALPSSSFPIPDQLKTLLICDDDPIFHFQIKHQLPKEITVLSAYHCDEALSFIKKYSVDLLFLDIHIRTLDEGLVFIPEFLKIDPNLAILVTSCTSDFRTVRTAMRTGALDYFVKNLDSEDLALTLNRVMAKQSLLKRASQREFELTHAHKKYLLIGQSTPIRDLRKRIEKAQNSFAHVIITGETGTGKELVARQLRTLQKNGNWMPFIAIDSATIQQNTAESLLFGHEKGAFTGADRTVKGAFEEAHQGILYFDEISNMPLPIQAKLLRAIQEKEITRVGSSKTIPLDFRVVCATNDDLAKLVQSGQFKDDLLQRLDVISIRLPPLRERIEDLPLLIEFFLTKHGAHLTQDFYLKPETFEVLKQYSWPGNVRELENLMINLIETADTRTITTEDLPAKYRAYATQHSSISHVSTVALPDPTPTGLYDRMYHHERTLLQKEYDQHRGNVSQLARHLKIDRSHLYSKLTKLGIHTSKVRTKIYF